MKKLLLILFCSQAFAEPWISANDLDKDVLFYELQRNDCKFNLLINSYPFSYGNYVNQINNYIDKNNISKKCKNYLNNLKSELNIIYKKPKTKIGFQSGIKDLYVQQSGYRYKNNSNLFYEHSSVSSNLAYKFRIEHDFKENKSYFDESYISLKLKNNIYSIGRISRWWSPSEKHSLILSNAARPSIGLEIKSYKTYSFNNNFLSKLGPYDFEFFINRLEKDREISNAMLIGNRITFYPIDSFSFSLFRTAQFGGDGRPTDSKTLLNLLIGRDNSGSSGITKENQPGNQLAGLDFNLNILSRKNLNLYGQITGEDEAGYLPSRNFYLLGLSYNFLNYSKPAKFFIDYADTYSGINNYTYSHTIYKSGYRYLGNPIGSSLDSDSEELSFGFKKTFSDKINMKIVFSDYLINKNDNPLNALTNKKLDFFESNLNLNININKTKLGLHFIIRDKKPHNFEKKNFFISFEIKL